MKIKLFLAVLFFMLSFSGIAQLRFEAYFGTNGVFENDEWVWENRKEIPSAERIIFVLTEFELIAHSNNPNLCFSILFDDSINYKEIGENALITSGGISNAMEHVNVVISTGAGIITVIQIVYVNNEVVSCLKFHCKYAPLD